MTRPLKESIDSVCQVRGKVTLLMTIYLIKACTRCKSVQLNTDSLTSHEKYTSTSRLLSWVSTITACMKGNLLWRKKGLDLL